MRCTAIELGDDVMPVEQLVLAAGHRSAELGLPGLALPLYPLKGYSLSVPIGAQHQAPNVSITDYDRKIVYARIGEQLRVAAMVDIVGFDAGLEPKRLALIKRQAVETFPTAGDYAHGGGMGRHAPRHAYRSAADRRQRLSQPVAEPGPWRAGLYPGVRQRPTAGRTDRPAHAVHRYAGPGAPRRLRGCTHEHQPNPQQRASSGRRDLQGLGVPVRPGAGCGQDVATQTREVLDKIDALLAQAGSDKDHLLNATIYLKDIGSGFAPMNEVWSAWLSPGQAPTRTTVQAELARPSVLVEISVIAARK